VIQELVEIPIQVLKGHQSAAIEEVKRAFASLKLVLSACTDQSGCESAGVLVNLPPALRTAFGAASQCRKVRPVPDLISIGVVGV